MKGISEWIWIVGGIIGALIVFAIAYNQILLANRAIVEQRSIDQFKEVVSKLKTMCWEIIGRKEEIPATFGDMVEGVYSVKSNDVIYEKEQLINSIILNKNSTGDFICQKIEGKRVNCYQLDCNATFPFIGYVPKEFSLSALVNSLMGKGSLYVYNLVLLRTSDGIDVYLLENLPTTTTLSGSSTTTTLPTACSPYTSCTSCTGQQGCGWCRNLDQCKDGTSTAPTDGSCSGSNWAWSSTQCTTTTTTLPATTTT